MKQVVWSSEGVTYIGRDEKMGYLVEEADTLGKIRGYSNLVCQ